MYGRGEVLRVALAATKMPFESVDISEPEWAVKKLDKKNYPSGGLPMLVTPDGCRMGETMPTARFIGIKGGVYPTDPEECWACDSLMDCATDIHNASGAMLGPIMSGDAAQIEPAVATYCATLDNFLKVMNGRLEGHGKKFLVKDTWTPADFAWATVWFNFVCNPICPPLVCGPIKACFEKYPKVHAWAQCMAECMKDYLTERHATRPCPI
jgi:glutathione S-transferase